MTNMEPTCQSPSSFSAASGLPLLGSLLPISRDALRFFNGLLRDRGDRVRLRVLGRHVLLLCHPEDIEQILVGNQNAYGRSAEVQKLRPIFGQGLLASEGDLWRRQRAAIQPSFQHDALAQYSAVMLETINRLLSSWTDGETRDIHVDMMRYTRETICRVLFGDRLAAAQTELSRAVTVVFGQLRSEVLYLPLWRLLPTARSRAWNQAVRTLSRTIREIIQSRRNSSANHGDLLEALLRARNPEGTGMSNQQIHDEILTFFLAGHETAALSLTWACYLLAENPQMQQRIREEAQAASVEGTLTPASYPKLIFTAAVVKEALRLYPPVWSMGRRAVVHTELDGQPIPKGTDIWICLYRTHRDPRWYAEPDRFLPERWLHDPTPRPFTYLPFGIGPRVCIGQHFAMMEAVFGLAAILLTFSIRQPEPCRIEPSAWITLRPGQQLSLQTLAWR